MCYTSHYSNTHTLSIFTKAIWNCYWYCINSGVCALMILCNLDPSLRLRGNNAWRSLFNMYILKRQIFITLNSLTRIKSFCLIHCLWIVNLLIDFLIASTFWMLSVQFYSEPLCSLPLKTVGKTQRGIRENKMSASIYNSRFTIIVTIFLF